MNKFLLLLVVTLLISPILKSQSIEEDESVVYMKANVLFEAGRYDEAIRIYNRILGNNEHHVPSLFMRAKAKYELGAYKGTKNDVLLYIEKAGVNKQIIHLMANTELKLSNLSAATQYAKVAVELDPYDDQLYLLQGTIALAMDNRNEACESFAKSAQMGNNKAIQRMEQSCAGYVPNRPGRQNTEIVQNQSSNEETNAEESTDNDDGIVTLEDIVREAESGNIPSDNEGDRNGGNVDATQQPDMNASQVIEIDSKLNITFSDGIGDRSISSQPSIFMLSDQDGKVVIDLCIDADGKVSEANFNREQSSIFRSSLTSLALRKAKEFLFNPSSRFEQCGKMVYNIKS